MGEEPFRQHGSKEGQVGVSSEGCGAGYLTWILLHTSTELGTSHFMNTWLEKTQRGQMSGTLSAGDDYPVWEMKPGQDAGTWDRSSPSVLSLNCHNASCPPHKLGFQPSQDSTLLFFLLLYFPMASLQSLGWTITYLFPLVTELLTQP